MNIKDPYSEMIKLMQQHGQKYNPPSIQLGKVISDSPIAIQTGDIQLNENNLLIADYLLSGCTRSVSVETTSVSGKTDTQNNLESLSFTGQQRYTNGLNENDTVVLIQLDTATFIILCKVVKP